jgi:hypothetical protein
VTPENLSDTVCVPGWTKAVRPSTSYVAKLKRADMRALDLLGSAFDYHQNHRVPLCAGGHPTDAHKLVQN